ncbi:MAG: GNAT family N-acetyltransferase, partial [Candidatus Limnocylindria bacterium]
MSDAFTMRRATEADRPEIVRLIRQCLGDTNPPWDEAFWTWKHERSPFGASHVLLAVANREIIGLRVFMRWQWRSGSTAVDAVRAVDTATHPAWRGRRIFNRLTLALADELAAEGVSFVFNTPNSISRPGYLKMGWRDVGRTSLLIRPRRPIALLRGALAPITNPRRLDSAPSLDQARKDDDGSTAPGSGTAAQLLASGEFAGLMDLRADDSEDRLHTHCTAAYVRWRFVDIPHVGYHALWCHDSGAAAIIFRLKRQGRLLELRICELLLGPGADAASAARRLLRELAQSSRADYIAAIGARGSAQRRVLLRTGFIPAPRLGPALTVRPLAGGVPVDPLD